MKLFSKKLFSILVLTGFLNSSQYMYSAESTCNQTKELKDLYTNVKNSFEINGETSKILLHNFDSRSLAPLVLSLKDESPLISSCKEKVIQGIELTVDEALALIPSIIEYAENIDRAARVDAQNPNDNDAIVGRACCDLTPVIALLGAIKKILMRIETEILNIFTAIADLKDTVTECCAELKLDFEFTWTILADIKDTITECCEELKLDFDFTWTILADIKDTITECCEEIHNDFIGVFTAIADLKDTVTECCADIKLDFDFTWTILGDIKDTLTACCEETHSDFIGVFTAISDLKDTVTECCADITNDFSGVFTAIASAACACDTSIEITAPITITVPGSYCLINDIAGDIVIAADRVYLNMNEKRISSGGISAAGVSEIEIRNGVIESAITRGIDIFNCDNVTIHDVDVISSPSAIVIEATDLFEVQNVHLQTNTTVHIVILDNVVVERRSSNGVLKNIQIATSSLENVIQVISSDNILFDGLEISDQTMVLDRPAIEILSCDAVSMQHTTIFNVNYPVNSGSIIQVDLSEATIFNDLVLAHCSARVNLKGIDIEGSTDTQIFNSSVNNSAGTACDGFFALASIKTFINNSSATDNRGTATCRGFAFESETLSCILNSSAKNNTTIGETDIAVGIDLIDTVSCTVRNNIVVNNINIAVPGAGFDFGIRATTSAVTLTTVILNNQSQGHFNPPSGGTSGIENDFFISPGAVPASRLAVATGVFTPMPPSPYDNISVQ